MHETIQVIFNQTHSVSHVAGVFEKFRIDKNLLTNFGTEYACFLFILILFRVRICNTESHRNFCVLIIN